MELTTAFPGVSQQKPSSNWRVGRKGKRKNSCFKLQSELCGTQSRDEVRGEEAACIIMELLYIAEEGVV